jgi:poly(A) polymerase
MRVWNPSVSIVPILFIHSTDNPQLYQGDRRHLMPIITPSYPSMCATHNVTTSTKAIVLRELKRADKIVGDIAAGKLAWKDLFAKHAFFTDGYKYYLSIVSASRTKEGQQMWSGLVQSKVRRLVQGIEMSDTGVKLAHPFNKGFERVHQCTKPEEVDMIFQGDLRFQKSEEDLTKTEDIALATNGESDGSSSESPPPTTIWTTTFYIGLELGSDRGAEQSKKLDITHPVAEFRRQCTEWAFFDPVISSLRTVHTRNYDLPADVFEIGEQKPERAKTKKAKNPRGISSKTSKITLNSATSEPATPDSRKRKNADNPSLEEDGSSTSLKKPNLSNGHKRGIEAEVR